ncbi:MAG: hypothetical protein QXS24_01835 [Desulfurococcaceae archaeon]
MSYDRSIVIEKLSKYFELTRDDMFELYDQLDTLYNEIITKYLEALADPKSNEQLVKKLFELALLLLNKDSLSVEEELTLISILDILATDLHDKTIGFISAEEAGEER